ncbi:hypothetical protein TWF694_009300 [Orbilia ellipsospora]|uniref:Calponin-homology (CH) domain-containing protein n=1 Tax=Orbilia ellipsospora TaxID=2528407 RepID=A0AAV9XH86_9PEZI
MDLEDTPCPPITRRKRLRPASPDITFPFPDNDTDSFTAEFNQSRRPLNSLTIAPKRRKIPLNLLKRVAADRKQPSSDTSISKDSVDSTSNEISHDDIIVDTKHRRMSTRSQTANLLSSPATMQPNNSILHTDISSIDSSSATILPNSSPNVSTISNQQTISNPPPKKRRRISELVRRVAAAAVAKTKPTPAPIQSTTTTTTTSSKPKLTQTKAPVKPKKDVPKRQAPPKKKPSVPTASKPRSSIVPRRTSTASTTSITTALPKSRPALKAVSRGMNPPTRPLSPSRKQSQSAISSTLPHLRLQKPKSASDTEFTKSKITKPAQQKKPTRKSASSYPSLLSSSSNGSTTTLTLNPSLHASSTIWISNQEVLLESILNDILTSATSASSKSSSQIREELLEVYNTEVYVNLHERLKASILHGVLKPTEEQLSDDGGGVSEDLGERDKFVRLFTETYSPEVLKAGMEVVTGRCIDPTTNTATTSIPAMAKFFETFFIDVQDDSGAWESYGSNHHGNLRVWVETETEGGKAWRLRRVTLRCLMLVHLLDYARTQNVFNGRLLFRKESGVKGSEEMVNRVCKALLPSLGNASRCLRSCKYIVMVTQKAEEEYEWGIRNLRVDLRDGVRLMKAVQLLGIDEGNSMDGISLMPKSRKEKVGNVERVVGVLVKRGVLPEGSVRARDIVDGHREVTLSVLWAVVGGVAVEKLVDWSELERETARLARKYRIELDLQALVEGGMKGYLARLENWVKVIIAGRNGGEAITVRQLLSERVVDGILNEYENLVETSPSTCEIENERGIKERLKYMGCSEAFMKLFAPPERKENKVFNERFAISALAFLASRVLTSSRRNRCTITLQRWWRRVDFRRNVFHKIQSILEEAREIERMVQSKREEWATRIIQRAWRRAVEQRVQQLVCRIVGVQAVIRGVLIRRKWDYSFKSGKKEAKREFVGPKKDEADPYKLRDVEDGDAVAGKPTKKGRRRKAKVVDDVEGLGDIWQDLADIQE